MGNILTTINTRMATTVIVRPEVRLFSLTGHNSPTRSMGMMLNPMPWAKMNPEVAMTNKIVIKRL